ncbi:hypothetical protein J6590_050602 [Homalodisca vitripennis]|nr:hypothetical protein J6590_050602 [Homalodisca vitripennis]
MGLLRWAERKLGNTSIINWTGNSFALCAKGEKKETVKIRTPVAFPGEILRENSEKREASRD